jgi:hypothetical protein
VSTSEVSVTPAAQPFIPRPPKPDDQPPTVGIAPLTGTVLAGVPVTIAVWADHGAHRVWIPADLGLDNKPEVTYTQTMVSLDNVEVKAATVVVAGITP